MIRKKKEPRKVENSRDKDPHTKTYIQTLWPLTPEKTRSEQFSLGKTKTRPLHPSVHWPHLHHHSNTANSYTVRFPRTFHLPFRCTNGSITSICSRGFRTWANLRQRVPLSHSKLHTTVSGSLLGCSFSLLLVPWKLSPTANNPFQTLVKLSKYQQLLLLSCFIDWRKTDNRCLQWGRLVFTIDRCC